MFCQVKFRCDDYDQEILGGIAKLDDNDNIEYVICGCCGSIFEPDTITILKRYGRWCNISDEIINNLLT